MSCILWGVGVTIFAVLCILLLLAYGVNWDRLIREAVQEVEREWSREEWHE